MVIFTSTLFLIFPIISAPVVVLAMLKYGKYRKFYGLLLAMILGMIMYHIDLTNLDIDLKVYYNYMNHYKFMNFIEMKDILLTQKEPITNFLFYIISLTGNFEIWQFVTTVINYFIIFYIFADYAKINQVDNKFYGLILITTIFWLNNIFLLTAIRNNVALTIYILVLYNEYIKKKKNFIYKLLYIVPVCIHMTLIIGVIIRILLNINLRKNKVILLFGLLIYAFSPNLIITISNLIGDLSLFSDLSLKTSYYTELTTSFNTNSIVHIVFLVLMIVLYYNIKRKNSREVQNTELYKATEVYLLFNLCSFNYWDIFYRWFDMSVILFAFILMDNISIIKKYMKFIILVMFLSILISCYIQFSNLQKLNIQKNIGQYCYKNVITIFNKEV